MPIQIHLSGDERLNLGSSSILYLPNTVSLEHLQKIADGLCEQDVIFSADTNTSRELTTYAARFWNEVSAPKKKSISEENFKKLETNYYRNHAWGSKKNSQKIRQLELDAEKFVTDVSDVKERLLQAKKDGELAYSLVNSLLNEIKKFGFGEKLDKWVKATSDGLPNRVIESILREKKNKLSRLEKNKIKAELNKGYRISSEELTLTNDIHPNFLPALKPSTKWTVAIDETGEIHDPNFASEAQNSFVGKFVALIVPESISLPPLDDGFHATDEIHAVVEENLRRLTSQPVGIFGFSVKDPVVFGDNWYQQIDLLIRWVLRLLPIDQHQTTTVKFEVEQTTDYRGSALSIRAESILAELKRISPARYSNLELHMKFVKKKESKFNGYVDTIANCWGSPTPERKALLQHFKLEDHCLLSPDSNGLLERTLIALNDGHSLLPEDWYRLASSINEIGSRTLVDDVLLQLGETAQNAPYVWIRYLAEVQERLRVKEASPHILSRAIGWLNTYKPKDHEIPKIVKLQYRAAQLALDNHQGLSAQDVLAETMALAFQLLDEDAPQAAEVILRSVISMTNAYSFDLMLPYIDKVLEEEPKVFGLKNYGKLLSTRGQLAAFKEDYEGAVNYFDQALLSFNKLSDPIQRSREIKQTQSYRMFALLDKSSANCGLIKDQCEEFVNTQSRTNLNQAVKHMHTWEGTKRFAHHLLLRALATERLKEEYLVDQYIASFDDWVLGEDHPWQLIAFYRAILLARHGRIADAQQQIRLSLDICDGHPHGTITWIGTVIERCASQLDLLPKDLKADAGKRFEIARRALPNAPINHLETAFSGSFEAIDDELRLLLPFNFR
ncbi:hypothetical protein [Marinobacterium marinum]|uniref:Tetratricopeptide repeat protein n=1 Tax=Marinobacterium marinum TaxID=2756129 RepID=A0A7W1WV87_9GAMM|nr:hypothetical protein [Marinobacterium marinum]MBA4500859.1 hypothetical protein [Marinobacterium marinum]